MQFSMPCQLWPGSQDISGHLRTSQVMIGRLGRPWEISLRAVFLDAVAQTRLRPLRPSRRSFWAKFRCWWRQWCLATTSWAPSQSRTWQHLALFLGRWAYRHVFLQRIFSYFLALSFSLFIFLLVYLVYTILLQRSLKQVPKKNQPHQSCARLLLLLWFTCWATWASYSLHLNRCSQYPARLHQSVRPMEWTRGKQETFANLWIVQVWWECAHTEGHTGMWKLP